ncbi:MAG: helix-turn-helix transcriptional regulator [Saccharofermentanales bacterium]
MNPLYENFPQEIRITNPSNLTFPAHLHADLEILYVQSGRIEVTINDQTRIMEAGSFALAFPHCIHSYSTSDGESSRIALIIVKPQNLTEYTRELLHYHPYDPFINPSSVPEDAVNTISRLLQEDVQNNILLCRAFLRVILASIWYKLELNSNSDTRYADITYKVVEYVMQNYKEALTLNNVAHALGIGRYPLSRIFSAKLKVGFNNYVNTMRINHAQALLANSDLSITAIAYECGFENTRTFDRAFLKNCSITPRRYRSLYPRMPKS